LIAAAALAVTTLAIPAIAFAQAAVPSPAPTPSITPTPQATPTPVLHAFRCSCSTPGQPVVWAGQVSALNFFSARQAAVGHCLSAIGAKPVSPLIPPASLPFTAALPTPLPPMFNPCSSCACN
jgi:hypothetical protein